MMVLRSPLSQSVLTTAAVPVRIGPTAQFGTKPTSSATPRKSSPITSNKAISSTSKAGLKSLNPGLATTARPESTSSFTGASFSSFRGARTKTQASRPASRPTPADPPTSQMTISRTENGYAKPENTLGRSSQIDRPTVTNSDKSNTPDTGPRFSST